MAFFSFIPLLLAILVFYNMIAFFVRRKLRKTWTALDDIPLLATAKEGGSKLPGVAIVCGGSIAGLLSARVCADHFENVLIIDPEAWIATEEGLHDRHRQSSGDSPSPKRTRVPQYTSLHDYQPFTLVALRRLFLNFDHEVARKGARILPANPHVHPSGVPLPAPLHQYKDGILPKTMFLSRPAYETTLRRLVLSSCMNVKYMTGSVTALLPHATSTNSIASVSVRSSAGEMMEIKSTLVVDCTGPALGGLRWLQDWPSFPDLSAKDDRISKTSYDHKMSYTTCEFDVPSNLIHRLQGVGLPRDYQTTGNLFVYFADPKMDQRTLIITRRENDFLQFACGGWDIRERMTDIADIKNFVSSIVSARPMPSWIQAILDILQEENIPVTYVYARCPPSVYVQYHRAAHLPFNFVAVGDSVLQLNPVRGQGCTKACVDAVTLNAFLVRLGRVCLPAGHAGVLPDDFGRSYFAAQAKRTGHLWAAFKADDYAWKSTTPVPGEDLETFGAWRRAYSAELSKLAFQDKDVAGVLWHTVNWLSPPTDVFSPLILFKIAWNRLSAAIGL